ncbi:hypothetical protein GGR56DRAFT_634763 [Xylariaceae sp. FL0804]|nr:hypothetical protein GGR56DRAFT_634763 [Xylariaceae sp. FL0804]
MSRTGTGVARVGQMATRSVAARSATAAVSRAARVAMPRPTGLPMPSVFRSAFSTSSRVARPLSFTSDELQKAAPVKLTDDLYNELADDYLDILLGRFEELADDNPEIDVEYSAGVMNIKFPDLGTYVINKQPPNKQIWLSSPKSGPKRYDYMVISEGQDQKQDTARGYWMYARDNSRLNDLLFRETGVDMDEAPPTPPAGHV